MRVEVSDIGPCRKAMKVEVPAERVKQEYDRVVAVYRKQAKIPGFRPGNAPEELVRRRFGKEIIEDVKEGLVPQSYHEALEKEGMDVVAILGVQDVVFLPDQPLTFSVMLDVPPQFKIPKYKSIGLKGEKVKVTEDDVAEALEGIRRQYSTFEDVVDRGIQKGDLVQIDYEGFCDEKTIEEIAPEAGAWAKGTDFWVRMDETAFLPGLGDELLGETVGQKKQVFVDFDEKCGQQVLVGRKGSYFVDVKAIREEQVAEINEEFLEKIGVKSQDELRSRIHEDLETMGKQREEGRLKNEIAKHLLKQAKFDLPESLVTQETRNAVYDAVREHTARGIAQGEIESRKGEIFEAATQGATERIKLRYVLHRIAEEEKVSVSDEDLSGHIEMMSARYGMEPARLRAELEEKGSLENVREDLRMHKTMDFLLNEANVKV